MDEPNWCHSREDEVEEVEEVLPLRDPMTREIERMDDDERAVALSLDSFLRSSGQPVDGKDADDDDLTYPTISDWTGRHPDRAGWYRCGHRHYEEGVDATVDGMLGGFARITGTDLDGSARFIRDVKRRIRPELRLTAEENGGRPTVACECGAGIGRVTKGLLLPVLGMTRCDLVETSGKLLSEAPSYLGEDVASRCRFLRSGLQDFEPAADSYDLVWVQWVIGYLRDADLVKFLRRCGDALREGGVLVIKDNVCDDVAFVADRDDASKTRSLPYIRAIADLAGLSVVHEEVQGDFPSEIFPVPMIALEKKRS